MSRFMIHHHVDDVAKTIALLIIVTCCCFVSPQINQNQLQNNNDNIWQDIALGSEKFSLNLFKRISDALTTSSYDFMISPFSVWSLLVLINEGAAGNTRHQLETNLGINSDLARLREGYKQVQEALRVDTPTVKVSYLQTMFANSKHKIKSDYERIIKGAYKASLEEVDFQRTAEAQKQINNFVRDGTGGLIDYVVNENDLINAQIILVSTIYFKGQWKFPFNKTLTRIEPFYDETGNVIGNVPMMFNREVFPYAAIAALESHVLEIPYGKENRLSMLILLPRKGATLNTVLDRLQRFSIPNIFAELKKTSNQYEDDEIEVYLPRFSTTSDFILNIVLEQMGIQDLFDSTKSDLSNISEQQVYLSRLFHKTVIEVNEEGTVASAATGGVFANKASPTRYYVNRPFAYIIVEKTTNSLLFCGQVKDPTKSNKI